MRKLKLQVQITIDGYIAGLNGEMDWMTFPWTDDIGEYVKSITAPVDTILLGRKLAQGFIPHWAGVAADASNPEVEAGKKFTNTPKVVFTKTLKAVAWPNTALAGRDLVEEVNALKSMEGEDLIAYGGGKFVSNLISENLIDEYHLFVNPAALGTGMKIFKQRTQLKHIKSQSFDCGIVVLVYEKA
ncbi:MAG: dihydrofolate reductase family protein [Lewinella sp.]|uniref:dihydrofolate reductase family protein n=1 Tax=Lewinella sp. TaxID=2004506 RepID=UPI003D6B4174